VELSLKPDFEETRNRWRAFWAHEIIDRPAVWITAPKDGVEPVPAPSYLDGWDGDYEAAAERYWAHAQTVWYGGESLPAMPCDFGPDQMASFLGAELVRSPDSPDTTWAVPFVERWEDVLPLRINEDAPRWQGLQEFMRTAASVGEGRFLVRHIDMHPNIDLLEAIRGGVALCMDLVDRPETIHQAMRDVRALYPIVYDRLREAGNMRLGTTSWLPFYCEGRFQAMQCDFSCMVSPAMFREFVLPALEEEAAFLDHAVYHLDGPDALVHLPDLLAIPGLDGIQWVPGAGRGEQMDWTDLYKRIQKAGKVQPIGGSIEALKQFHRDIGPEGILYITSASSQKEGEEFLEWMVANT
jgi:hypothetical protein